MKTQVIILNGYAYEVIPCGDNHEHGLPRVSEDALWSFLHGACIDGAMPCVDGLLFRELPYEEDERAYHRLYDVAFYAHTSSAMNVRPVVSFADRGRVGLPNATYNGRRVYAERLSSPFLGFSFRVFERQQYGSMEAFARFDEVALDRNVPFSSLRCWETR